MDVHMMYMTEEGQLHQWDTDVPFSQYTELDGDYGTNATAWIMPIMTAMELDITEPQQLNIRAGIANQYTIFERTVLDVVEDAFSPSRDVAPVVEQRKIQQTEIILQILQHRCRCLGLPWLMRK
jgi:hypothetical protein